MDAGVFFQQDGEVLVYREAEAFPYSQALLEEVEACGLTALPCQVCCSGDGAELRLDTAGAVPALEALAQIGPAAADAFFWQLQQLLEGPLRHHLCRTDWQRGLFVRQGFLQAAVLPLAGAPSGAEEFCQVLGQLVEAAGELGRCQEMQALQARPGFTFIEALLALRQAAGAMGYGPFAISTEEERPAATDPEEEDLFHIQAELLNDLEDAGAPFAWQGRWGAMTTCLAASVPCASPETTLLQRQLFLVCPRTGASALLSQEGVVVGKSASCDVQVVGNGAVSRRHARIGVNASGRVWVEDLGSTNGTFAGGVRLEPRKPAVLRDGEALRISDEEFCIQEWPGHAA